MRRASLRTDTLIILTTALFSCVFAIPFSAHAQTATSTDAGYVASAVVLQVVSDTPTGATTTVPQNYDEIVTARITGGSEYGKTIELEVNYTDGDGQKLERDDSIYVGRYLEHAERLMTVYSYYSIDHDRLPVVILFLALFFGCVIYFGGKQGIRGLVSLIGGISFIIFLLLPGITYGYSPLLLSVVVASFVATLGAYVTHGFSRMTTSAIIGMIGIIAGTAVLAEIGVHFGHLSGVTDENSYNLLISPNGNTVINFQGLLLGGIIIGLLGVLYDAAIGQAVAVEELWRAAPQAPRALIYERAYRIGREHIGALVNTLVLAYVGASLPVMITLYQSLPGSNGYAPPVLNWEFVATEVIRTTVGAVGLILTIPVTTWVAVLMLAPERVSMRDSA